MSATSHMARPASPAAPISEWQRLSWCVRRELWEYPSIYLLPLIGGLLAMAATMLNVVHLPERLLQSHGAPVHGLLEQPFDFAALLVMSAGLLVGIFYSLDALHGERRDRSILFWKSLPVSDVTTVLAKASIPLIVIPVICALVTMATHLVMLVLGSVRLMGTGVSLWEHVHPAHLWLMVFYHMLAAHSLWWAPFWAWLLLVSAWARRAPFLWATMPAVAIALVERIAFNTSYFADFLRERVLGGPANASAASGSNPMSLDAMTPAVGEFLSSPSFWMGLVVAAAFLAITVRLRRSQEPS